MGQPNRTDALQIVFASTASVLGLMLLFALPINGLDWSAGAENLASIVLSALAFLAVSITFIARSPISRIDLGWVSCPSHFVVKAVLLGIILLPVTGLLAALIRTCLGETWENPQLEALDVSSLGIGAEVLMTFCVILLMPLLEELFFRGIIFSQLQIARGRSWAVGGSALLFALFHLQIDLVAGTFVLGLVMGVLRARSGSVWPAFVLHSTNNGLAWLLAYQGLGL